MSPILLGKNVDLVLITCDAKTHPGGRLLKFMCSPSYVIPLQQLRSVLVYIRERIVRADLPLGARVTLNPAAGIDKPFFVRALYIDSRHVRHVAFGRVSVTEYDDVRVDRVFALLVVVLVDELSDLYVFRAANESIKPWRLREPRPLCPTCRFLVNLKIRRLKPPPKPKKTQNAKSDPHDRKQSCRCSRQLPKQAEPRWGYPAVYA